MPQNTAVVAGHPYPRSRTHAGDGLTSLRPAPSGPDATSVA
jgi:hypothetical protein